MEIFELGTHPSKQYIKGKPNPWGLKVYVLCGKSGQPYDFFVYQGSSTELSEESIKLLGYGAATVAHFAERLREGHCLYFDNFFTNYNILEMLKMKKINAAGTVRLNMMKAPPLLTDKEMSSKPRGSSDSVVSVIKMFVL
jgi:hypothetical protein